MRSSQIGNPSSHRKEISTVITRKSLWAFSLLVIAAAIHAQEAPRDWVDPATGHRIIRLSGDEGGSSLYFHQNTYTPKGDKLVFDTKAGIVAIDVTRLGQEPVKPE